MCPHQVGFVKFMQRPQGMHYWDNTTCSWLTIRLEKNQTSRSMQLYFSLNAQLVAQWNIITKID